MTIPLSSSIAVSSEVLCQEVHGETVLLDLQSESYFGLDEVGTRVWQLLQENPKIEAVVDTLLEEYDVDEQQLRDDLNELLSKLAEKSLITIRPAK